MIANPTVPAFRYDPYNRVMTREEYAHAEMRRVRRAAVERARDHARTFGVVLGTLGRQGNPAILEHLEARLKAKGLKYVVFLISEMNPAKMALLKGADAFVQIACPRLSIDWGEDFTKPVLTPYECEVALGFATPWWELEGVAPGEANAPYPMDYYAKDGGGVDVELRQDATAAASRGGGGGGGGGGEGGGGGRGRRRGGVMRVPWAGDDATTTPRADAETRSMISLGPSSRDR